MPADDAIILWLALVISLMGLIPQLAAGGRWGTEPTVALLVAAGSVVMLVRGRRS